MRAQGTRLAALAAVLWLSGCGLAPDSKSDQNGGDEGDSNVPLIVNGCNVHGRPYGGGEGSLVRPFLLCAAEHLQALESHDESPVHLKLATDIAIPGGIRIGMMGMLVGSFDGDRHIVTGLKDLPLFEMNGGVIANVILRDIDLVGSFRMGGLVGHNLAGARVSDCHVTGKLFVAYSGGGLVGFNEGIVEDSSTNVLVGGTNRTGGLIGFNRGTVRRSQAHGAVHADAAIAGGLVGEHAGGTVEDSFALGNVEAPKQAGGLIGICAGAVARAYSAGLVDSTDVSSGGLVGEGAGAVTASYWDTETSQQSLSAGGVGRTSVDLRNVSTFIGWNFAAIWKLPSGGTPELR